MSEEKSKFINFGSTLEFDKKDGSGKFEKIQIDAAIVSELIDFLAKYEEKYLLDSNGKPLPKGDIWAAQKLNYQDPNVIPRITIFNQDPQQGAPACIKNNLSINKDEF